jgi:hypothetical protein
MTWILPILVCSIVLVIVLLVKYMLMGEKKTAANAEVDKILQRQESERKKRLERFTESKAAKESEAARSTLKQRNVPVVKAAPAITLKKRNALVKKQTPASIIDDKPVANPELERKKRLERFTESKAANDEEAAHSTLKKRNALAKEQTPASIIDDKPVANPEPVVVADAAVPVEELVKEPRKSPSRKSEPLHVILARLLTDKVHLDVSLSGDASLTDMQSTIEASIAVEIGFESPEIGLNHVRKGIHMWSQLYELAQRSDVEGVVTTMRGLMQFVTNKLVDTLHEDVLVQSSTSEASAVREEDLFGSETLCDNLAPEGVALLAFKSMLGQNSVHFAFLKQLPSTGKAAAVVKAMVDSLQHDFVFKVESQETIAAATSAWNLITGIPSLPAAIVERIVAEVRDAAADATGRDFERDSCLGLLKLSCLFDETPNTNSDQGVKKLLLGMEGFPEFRSMGTLNAFLFQRSHLQEKLHGVHAIAHAVLRKAMRVDKNACFDWLAAAVGLSKLASTLRVTPHTPLAGFTNLDKLLPSPGFRLNVCAVLLKFCQPFIMKDAPETIDARAFQQACCRVDHSTEERLCWGGDASSADSASGQSATAAAAAAGGGTDASSLVQPITSSCSGASELYMLTVSAVHACIVPLVERAEHHQHILAQMQGGQQDPALKRHFEALHIAYEIQLFDKELVSSVVSFAAYTCKWLQRLSQRSDAAVHFAFIPAFVVKDLSKLLITLAYRSPKLLPPAATSTVIEFAIQMLPRTDLIRSPLVVSAVIDILIHFVMSDKSRWVGSKCSQRIQCCRSIHCFTCSDLLLPLCALGFHPPSYIRWIPSTRTDRDAARKGGVGMVDPNLRLYISGANR